jgi:hypothetical protein
MGMDGEEKRSNNENDVQRDSRAVIVTSVVENARQPCN